MRKREISKTLNQQCSYLGLSASPDVISECLKVGHTRRTCNVRSFVLETGIWAELVIAVTNSFGLNPNGSSNRDNSFRAIQSKNAPSTPYLVSSHRVRLDLLRRGGMGTERS